MSIKGCIFSLPKPSSTHWLELLVKHKHLVGLKKCTRTDDWQAIKLLTICIFMCICIFICICVTIKMEEGGFRRHICNCICICVAYICMCIYICICTCICMTIKMEEGDCGGISVIASGAWEGILPHQEAVHQK